MLLAILLFKASDFTFLMMSMIIQDFQEKLIDTTIFFNTLTLLLPIFFLVNGQQFSSPAK